ncbi:uncharacterized protein [Acropora muricata]|uniref:uncharacterized protein isoform X2 n=1 Tax=Acropora muricata TaxID=159855 RepID=UPI0034E57123
MALSLAVVQRIRWPFIRSLKLPTLITFEPLGLGIYRLITSRNICSGHDSNVWQDVLDYWFAPGGEMKWFLGGPQVDKEIQEKFGAIGTPKAFSGDAIARPLSRKFIEGKTHNHLEFTCSERAFIYMPLEHNEDKEDQELAVKLFAKLADDFKGTEDQERAINFLEFAKKHKKVIEMFGRFPQRNKALGRENTQKEEQFMSNIPEGYKW